MPVIRACVNLLCCLAGLAFAAAALARLNPAPRINIVTPKLSHLAAQADSYDVLFLGSSRTYRQILPEIFDHVMSEGGYPMRAFNLGVDGMRPPEDTYVLEKALALRNKPLRFVFVESNALRRALPGEDQDTLRAIYWHDWKRLTALFRRAFLADEKKRNWRDRLGEISKAMPDFSEHAEHWLENSTQLGRGNTLLEEWFRRGRIVPLTFDDVGPRLDGYDPFHKAKPMNSGEIAAYDQIIAEMRSRPPRADYAEWVSQAEVQEKRRLIERAGGQMILIIPPYGGSKMFYPRPGPDAPPVLDFSDPDRYPKLFAVEHRQDRGHTNIEGSKLYTRALAQAFLELLPKLPPRQP